MFEPLSQLRNIINQAPQITPPKNKDIMSLIANECSVLLGQIHGVFNRGIHRLHYGRTNKYAELIGIYIDQLRQLTSDISNELERARPELSAQIKQLTGDIIGELERIRGEL